MENLAIIQTVKKTVESIKKEDGWIDMAALGKPLNDKGINYKALGFQKMKVFFEDMQEYFEIKKDSNHQPPVYYVRCREVSCCPTDSQLAQKSKRTITDLLEWAYMGDFKAAINKLKDLARDERWYYKEPSPEYPYPILTKYLKYTFFKLVKDDKIRYEGNYASFNTGLVNDLYEPIYALFQKNKIIGKQKWFFIDFCLAGENRAGKTLTSYFNPLPERAQYYKNPSELIYDYKETPQLDWEHIILENVDRLPHDFLNENVPSDFLLKNVDTMGAVEKEEYKQALAKAIRENTSCYRAIKNRFEDSLKLAIKRVTWNYKTAIPMYYPKGDKTSLLLPLSLLKEDQIDLALVTERKPSGSYLGHTILPLDWAYSNARLVTSPDSDWLIPAIIEPDMIREEE